MKNFKQQASSFFRTVWKSLTDIRFYRGVRHKGVGEAVSYLAVLVSIAWFVPFLVMFFVNARGSLASFLVGFDRHVPAGTVFEMKGGAFSNSLEAPIVIRQGNAVVIVNTATSTLAFDAKDYGVILTQREIVERAGDGQEEKASLAKVPDFSFSKERIQDRLRSVAPWVIAILALVGLCAFTIVTAFSVTFVTALHALVLWMALRLLKKPILYREAWVLAAYALTPMIIAKAILSLLKLEDGGLPTALYWVMLGFIAYDLCKVPGEGKGVTRDERPKETDGAAGTGTRVS